MKKILSLLVITMFALIMFTPAYAGYYGNDYCSCNPNGQHEYYIMQQYGEHPHKCILQCGCGKEIEVEESIYDSCLICRQKLCDLGIHCYDQDITYIDYSNYSGYAFCKCGEKIYFEGNLDQSWIKRRSDGLIEIYGEYIVSPEHKECDGNDAGHYSDNLAHTLGDACGVCSLKTDFSIKVSEYNEYAINKKINPNYEKIVYDYDEDCDNNYGEFEFNYGYNESSDDYPQSNDVYVYEEEDEDFYEWLDAMKKLLK